MKKIILFALVVLSSSLCNADNHVLVVHNKEYNVEGQTEVHIEDDGWTETITLVTGDQVNVYLKDLLGNIIFSFSLTAEQDGDCPIQMPVLEEGSYVEIWVNNRLVYSYFD